MDIKVAKKLEELLVTCNVALDEFVAVVRKSVPSEERQPLIEGIGEIYAIQTDRIDVALKKFCPDL